MHKLSPGSAHSRKLPDHGPSRRPLDRVPGASRIALIALGAAAVLALLAWIDGGEEPLHAIVEPVALPSGGPAAQAGA